jgi:leucyl aminopeptidase
MVLQGITYDTGGADIKHGGAMAGMHRDKCGAAFVAGFFKVCSVHCIAVVNMELFCFVKSLWSIVSS